VFTHVVATRERDIAVPAGFDVVLLEEEPEPFCLRGCPVGGDLHTVDRHDRRISATRMSISELTRAQVREV
jgi:hypothetical protein